MPVKTRFQRHAELYASVLEQPLLLDNILSHLCAKDVVHLMMVGGPLVREPRFQDTIHEYLELAYEDHQLRVFLQHVNEKISHAQGLMYAPIVEQCRALNELYDFLLEHRYYIDSPERCWVEFSRMLEKRLLRDTQSSEYGMYALYYLNEFFGIQVQAYNDNDTGELVEYVRDRQGNMIVL